MTMRRGVRSKAMVLRESGGHLISEERDALEPGVGQVLIRVLACGVCRTDLHVVDGELAEPKLPLVPGHEIVGDVAATGAGAARFSTGDRVGVSWLASTCGECRYCRADQENLCEFGEFTGYSVDGGYADFVVADERYCFSLPDAYGVENAAPLMCAGIIGYRSLVRAGEGERLGIYGFGAAAHIITQVARFQGRWVFAFTRPGDEEGQRFARELGAAWAGDSTAAPPERLDAAIIFAPLGDLVPLALRAVRPGGTVVCGGIHMSDIPSFSYELLWGERTLCSVANVTRRDAEEFLAIALSVPVQTRVTAFALSEANEALAALRTGKLKGAAVLQP
jgi:alcohol dehydrogenase, propanol-preferring